MMTAPQNGMLVSVNCEIPVIGMTEMNTTAIARESKK